MTGTSAKPDETALLIVDLQNDFIHPKGAYARGGQGAASIAALPAKVAPLAQALHAAGGVVMATQFTLVPGRGGEPIISPHLLQLRPFLGKGDFAPGSWGQDIVEELQPIDVRIEKVAYSAFYMTRLEWLLRKLGISRLLVCGIVTNGGVASTVRDAHVRDIDVTVIEDCCAAFSDAVHRAAIEGMRPVAHIAAAGEVLNELKPPSGALSKP
jgi:ureidoacrylate peracid hydrolase